MATIGSAAPEYPHRAPVFYYVLPYPGCRVSESARQRHLPRRRDTSFVTAAARRPHLRLY